MPEFGEKLTHFHTVSIETPYEQKRTKGAPEGMRVSGYKSAYSDTHFCVFLAANFVCKKSQNLTSLDLYQLEIKTVYSVSSSASLSTAGLCPLLANSSSSAMDLGSDRGKPWLPFCKHSAYFIIAGGCFLSDAIFSSSRPRSLLVNSVSR